MKKKTIELTVEQARELLGKDEAMDVLIRANFTEGELKPKEKKGWYICTTSIEERVYNGGNFDKLTFPRRTQAEGVYAMIRLAQEMENVNGDWKPDWKDGDKTKYTIDFEAEKIKLRSWYVCPQFLAFPTPEIRDKFAEDHRDLILEYFKIYQ